MEETVDLNKHDTLRHKTVIYEWTQSTIQQRRIALFNSDSDQIQRTDISARVVRKKVEKNSYVGMYLAGGKSVLSLNNGS